MSIDKPTVEGVITARANTYTDKLDPCTVRDMPFKTARNAWKQGFRAACTQFGLTLDVDEAGDLRAAYAGVGAWRLDGEADRLRVEVANLRDRLVVALSDTTRPREWETVVNRQILDNLRAQADELESLKRRILDVVSTS